MPRIFRIKMLTGRENPTQNSYKGLFQSSCPGTILSLDRLSHIDCCVLGDDGHVSSRIDGYVPRRIHSCVPGGVLCCVLSLSSHNSTDGKSQRERAIRIANTMNPFDILLIANTPFTLCRVLGRRSEFKLFSKIDLFSI